MEMHPTQVRSAASASASALRLPAWYNCCCLLVAVTMMMCECVSTAFVVRVPHQQHVVYMSGAYESSLWAKRENESENKNINTQPFMFRPVPPEFDNSLVAFVETTTVSSSSGSDPPLINCHVDFLCTVEGIEYTIGVPCNYPVRLYYFGDWVDKIGQPRIYVELSDRATMDELFPVARAAVVKSFGEKVDLERTPQTLQLVGELDCDDDDDFWDFVAVFQHRGKEYRVKHYVDEQPFFLVGKVPDKVEGEVAMNSDVRVLLTPEELDQIMPVLEPFLQFRSLPRQW
jgi:hypothetical protein